MNAPLVSTDFVVRACAVHCSTTAAVGGCRALLGMAKYHISYGAEIGTEKLDAPLARAYVVPHACLCEYVRGSQTTTRG